MSAIRPATADDAAACVDVYNYYVLHTTATAQEKTATVSDFQALISKGDTGPLPFLVSVDAHGKPLGYCYCDLLKNRGGYRHTYEISIYVAHEAAGQGIGNALMTALLAAAQNTIVYKLVAIISLPNPVSVALHEKFGFVHCGTIPGAIIKLNQWIDAGYWMLDLKNGYNTPILDRKNV